MDLLQFESQQWLHPGAKERAITDDLGLTPTRYYQELNRLIDDEDAEARYPILVHRLRRLRRSRYRVR